MLLTLEVHLQIEYESVACYTTVSEELYFHQDFGTQIVYCTTMQVACFRCSVMSPTHDTIFGIAPSSNELYKSYGNFLSVRTLENQNLFKNRWHVVQLYFSGTSWVLVKFRRVMLFYLIRNHIIPQSIWRENVCSTQFNFHYESTQLSGIWQSLPHDGILLPLSPSIWSLA